MAHEIQYTSDSTGSLEKAQGSDNRFNVSSRSDGRAYYNSRENSRTFSLVWDDASSAAGDMILYWKNTDTTGKHLVIASIGLNSELACSFKLHLVTGTAASGSTTTPFCLNQSAPKTAAATAMEAAGTAITGLTSTAVIDHVACGADGHEEFRLNDRLRLGQDQAIAIEFEQGVTARTWGVMFGFYE